MRSKLILFLGCILPIGVFADDHAPTPNIAAVYECTLMDGVSADNLAAYGKGEFKSWVDENNYNVDSFLWEAIAVSPPFDAPDVRWVNYFESWADYYEISEGWEQSGELAEKFATMAECGKARFATVTRTGGSPTEVDEKPLIASVCQLNEGKTMLDAMAFVPKVTSILTETAGAEITSFVFTNFVGVTGPDYITFFTGETSEMVKVQDTGKNGGYRSAFMDSVLESPATCEADLHQSHKMVRG